MRPEDHRGELVPGALPGWTAVDACNRGGSLRGAPDPCTLLGPGGGEGAMSGAR